MTKRNQIFLIFFCLGFFVIVFSLYDNKLYPNPGASQKTLDIVDSSYSYVEDSLDITVKLFKLDEMYYQLVAHLIKNNEPVQTSKYNLNFPVYQFHLADIDGNGREDFCVGVIKKTHFDPVVRKRLFIFQLKNGKIRPLWLGSRLGQPLENFTIIYRKEQNNIRTLELEMDGSYLVCDYRWRNFGLEFIHYVDRFLDKETAFEYLLHSKGESY